MRQNKFTILHLITTLDVGGAEMMLLKLVGKMNPHFQNYVVSMSDIGPVGLKIQAKGIPVYALNMRHGKMSILGVIKLWRLMKVINPDLLQTWLYHADLLGLLLGKLAKIRCILWNIRCTNLELINYGFSTRFSLKLSSKLSHWPDVIITNSFKGQEDHARIGYRSKQWVIIPNGFDMEKYKPDDKAKPLLLNKIGLRTTYLQNNNKRMPYLIGMIARYDLMKNHSMFIKAASVLLNKRKDVHFILVGKNIEWGNKKLTCDIPPSLKEYFHLLGLQNDVEEITAALDIASSTSSYGEGFPNTIGEAMACCVPCVVTNVGDSAFIVGQTGIITPPDDPTGMAIAWEKILDMEPEERKSLGISARQRISSLFSIDKVVNQYEVLYGNIIQQRSVPG